jgi:hypothetical protein
MANIGKTTTPSTGSFGYVENYGSVGMQFTPTQSGLYSSVSFCAAAYSGSLKIHGVIWDASGNVLAFGPGVTTSGGTVGGDGDQTWYTDTFSSPVFIAANTTIFIGWQTDTHTQYVWAYNGNDHSPNAGWLTSAYGSTGQSFAGNTTMSPNGAVAAYATYTPASMYVRRSGAWSTAQQVAGRRSGAWSVATAEDVRRSGGWNQGQ